MRRAKQCPAVVPSSRRGKYLLFGARREDRAARKDKRSPRGQSLPILESAQVTGKVGEKGHHSGDRAARSSWTRPSAPGCVVTHSRPQRASARSRVGIRAIWLRGRHRLGHRLVVLLTFLQRGVGSMYSQAHVRMTRGRLCQRTGPSVAVRDRGH